MGPVDICADCGERTCGKVSPPLDPALIMVVVGGSI
jgi:hypothetical protein